MGGPMPVWIFATQKQRDQILVILKCKPCPRCKHCGALNRHGFLEGYDQQNTRQKVVRALRIYCSNRGNSKGCGRTFSVWIAEKVKRLFLNAQQLWDFLEQTSATGNKSRAFYQLQCPLSDTAPFRIWNRFLKAQTAIRTVLLTICQPPQQPSDLDGSPAQATVAHLKEAFKNSNLNPIAAFQVLTQRFFFRSRSD